MQSAKEKLHKLYRLYEKPMYHIAYAVLHVFYDAKAVELAERLDYDFSKASRDVAMGSGTIARTIVFDELVQTFLQKHPDATVVNIACGRREPEDERVGDEGRARLSDGCPLRRVRQDRHPEPDGTQSARSKYCSQHLPFHRRTDGGNAFSRHQLRGSYPALRRSPGAVRQ